MDQCALQLRAEIKCPKGKAKEFVLVNLNTGAIPTKEQAAVLAGNDAAAKAAIAKKALPKCNIVYRNGQEMKKDISAYLQVLYDASPAAVGGSCRTITSTTPSRPSCARSWRRSATLQSKL